MNLCQRLFGAGLIATGILGFSLTASARQSKESKKPSLEERIFPFKPGLFRGGGVNPPELLSVESYYGLKVGTTAQLNLTAFDTEGKNAGIKRATLYEDGEAIPLRACLSSINIVV